MTSTLYGVLGVVSAAFGVAVGTLVAAFTDPAFGPIEVVASTAVDIPPAIVKEWATSTFGTATKSIVIVVVIVAVVVLSAWAGVMARRRMSLGVLMMLVGGAAGAAAALLRPIDTLLAPIPALIAGGVAAVTLWALVRWSVTDVAVVPDGITFGDVVAPAAAVDRRGFLLGVGGVVLVGGALFASAR